MKMPSGLLIAGSGVVGTRDGKQTVHTWQMLDGKGNKTLTVAGQLDVQCQQLPENTNGTLWILLFLSRLVTPGG